MVQNYDTHPLKIEKPSKKEAKHFLVVCERKDSLSLGSYPRVKSTFKPTIIYWPMKQGD